MALEQVLEFEESGAPTGRAPNSLNTVSMLYSVEMRLKRWIPPGLLRFAAQSLWELPLERLIDTTSGQRSISLPPASVCRKIDASEPAASAVRRRVGESLAEQRWQAAHESFAILSGSELAKGSEVAGVAWLALERYDDLETGVRFPLEPHQAWLYGVWIDPCQRQQGWYRHLLNTLAGEAQLRGITHLRFGIDRTNQRSHRVHQRLGAQQVGSCEGIKLLGCGKFWVRWW